VTKVQSHPPLDSASIALWQEYNDITKTYNICQGGDKMGTKEHFHFDEVTLLSAFAVGAPGKRTFFLALGEKNNWLRIWLEKEHLKALAIAIEQLILTLSQEEINLPKEKEAHPLPDDVPSGLPSAELDVVEMTLGYDQGKATIELSVQRSGSREKDPADVYCKVTLARLKTFGNQAAKICAAGRPLCAICGGPIDPTGHVCPEQN
jgi:uncharacterized repeat protein (TIGR03847 family)